MSKSRPYSASRKPVYLIFALSLALSIGYVSLRTYLTPQTPQIMAITPSALTYGKTTLSGLLQQDPKGTFILVLSDMRVIILDVKGLDTLLGQSVSVSGDLSPNLTMKVSKITLPIK